MNTAIIFKEPDEKMLGELYNKSDVFQGQRKGEHIETIILRHRIVLIPTILITIFGLLSVLGINAIMREFVAESLPDNGTLFLKISLTVDFLFISLVIHFLFINLLNYYLKVVIITNFRIIDIKFTTIFARNMDALDLHNIQDINMTRTGFWRWLLNFGRIVMHNAAGTELFDFKYLKNPQKNYSIINHVHYKAMHNRTALQKEAIQHNSPEPKQTDWEDLSNAN